uniref:Uncharacterized protein n=1 Tax=Oryza brachyantha TaxID=4533 RepID=J3MDV0_ORYBR
MSGGNLELPSGTVEGGDGSLDADGTCKEFLGDICQKYPWGINETPSEHYVHAIRKELNPTGKDQDLTSMFECSSHTKRGDKTDSTSSESGDCTAKTDNVLEEEERDDLSIVDSDDEEWVAQDAKADNEIPQVAYDKDNPPMIVHTIYPSMHEFRLTISQYSIN